ncbi:lysophosphatidic acid receptor 6 [Oryzias melastigma]|uniref:lysophosphatidic acid receptor 6 n=1 Tax=Oryzias melastigma TaxID=30732 RepID=UPI000CF7FC40|nr:lysophosphatidic acid receptor 6 [Oryzias melastigma]
MVRIFFLGWMPKPGVASAEMNVTNCTDPEAEFQYHLFPTVYILSFVIGLPGNLAALYYFTVKISPRTPFSVYISNLAVADILILCTLPFRIHYHLNRNNWVFGDRACLLTGTLHFANIYTSIFFMTCICVDRYVATVHPHSYLRIRSSSCSLAVSVGLWSVCGVAILVFILMGPLKSGDASAGHKCFENFDKTEWENRLNLYSILVLGSLVPSAIILVCYPLAARRISRFKTKTAQKAIKVIYAILAITVLCFLPNHVVYLLHLLQRMNIIQSCSARRVIYNARRVTMALVVLNTCLDPVLYYMTTNHFNWRALKTSWLWGMVSRRRGIYTISVIEGQKSGSDTLTSEPKHIECNWNQG